ncbi:MAG TPA: AbrB/MazE/SpoVT family DNA-binding domain-containing protein [Candidatus Paceibacterota bacterium]|uniref:SpoVT-AbrB domain-containing protein n=1 Tax=Candidatus Kaiserbacteria bacterium RIFCSPHIGHO2_01_FULL_54_36b TaxID=1798483 RepID=A0A1F6CQP4_9BACT|nr:MAG: hypothetical protein A2704_03815 [Candidatus Kaiserbacteria bacterium RIFCSPHIGHO2_01_FULL_54_36b]
MSTKLQKWGNSLAVRIPDDVVEDAGLAPGTEVTVRKMRNSVVITPARAKKRSPINIDEMIERIRPETLHGETDWGPPVGKEVW